jgi:tol-pal system protein YbgF
MRRGAAGLVFVLAAACGSTQPPPPANASDKQLAELQTSLTELLERLDVMNDRIARLEQSQESSGAPVSSPAPASAARPRRAGGDTAAPPQKAVAGAMIADKYRNAVALFGRNRPVEARAAFQQVFDADPAGDLADNALFWIGETYFAAGDYGNATRFYQRVADDYSDQNKAPDALYKLALTQEKTGDLALARTTLQEVIRRYPYSSPAASAKGELQRIKY